MLEVGEVHSIGKVVEQTVLVALVEVEAVEEDLQIR
jgi:hypothetical protein